MNTRLPQVRGKEKEEKGPFGPETVAFPRIAEGKRRGRAISYKVPPPIKKERVDPSLFIFLTISHYASRPPGKKRKRRGGAAAAVPASHLQ